MGASPLAPRVKKNTFLCTNLELLHQAISTGVIPLLDVSHTPKADLKQGVKTYLHSYYQRSSFMTEIVSVPTRRPPGECSAAGTVDLEIPG